MSRSNKNSSSTSSANSFAEQCEKLYCANAPAPQGSIPSANEVQLTEINQLISEQHDWFFEILQQYRLNSKEGMLLMSLAEALLRIPDQQGMQSLFHDRLHRGQWLTDESKYTLLAKALQWLGNQAPIDQSIRTTLFNKITQQGAIEVCSLFIEQMSHRFVFAENLDEALLRSRKLECHEACSFDMLGEAALTYNEADEYYNQYQKAIITVGQYNQCLDDTPHEISIKLSALHPRYQPEKYQILKQELLPKLHQLFLLAKQHNVLLTLDAEEQYRLELSIKLLRDLLELAADKTDIINNIGVAVQAYGKRALATINELIRLSTHYQLEVRIRLVKGAYWDYEIKSAQQLGLKDYPVWSQKQFTDDNFLICAAAIIESKEKHPESNLIGQFATHNPETLLQLKSLQPKNSPLLFQRLHGMGEVQHAYMADNFSSQTRVYCPIGSHNKLLPYLVRRLIENGANSSFLYPKEEQSKNIVIPQPENILDYNNSISCDIRQDHNFDPLYKKIKSNQKFIENNKATESIKVENSNTDAIQHIGQVALIGLHTMPDIEQRVSSLNQLAIGLEENKDSLIALLVLQAGKSYQDAIDEVREACDFCRYYAKQANTLFSQKQQRQSITGELNQLSYKGKGITVCISPWNFPLAIFIGQIAGRLGYRQ